MSNTACTRDQERDLPDEALDRRGWIYGFNTGETPSLEEVGGKAMSLIAMTAHGLPVPPGFVLSVNFFAPWLAQIQHAPEWAAILSAGNHDLKQHCLALQMRGMALDLKDTHQQVLLNALERLAEASDTCLFAVRSSSPEEDLEELSFAGGYETTLGVTSTNLVDAVRRSFASCFDDRVFMYKREHGLALARPRIAVIVQRQVEAVSAGVAFSLNPLNNCYDEAVINANFGLGESVVSGTVSPDTFVVDKVSRAILSRRTGKKEHSLWLESDRDGGTYLAPVPDREQLSLSDEQVLRVTEMVARVEDIYGKPMDIEWAFDAGSDRANARLHLLQARPITAYVPLPPSLVTQPGAPKRLYLDASFKEGLTQPMSVLGTDYWSHFESEMTTHMTGRDTSDVPYGLVGFVQGRMYYNASNYTKLQGKKGLVNLYRTIDVPTAEIISQLDESEYIPAKLPRALRGIKLGVVRHSLNIGLRTAWALLHPLGYSRRFERQAERLRHDLVGIACRIAAPKPLARAIIARTNAFLKLSLPTLFASELARSRIKALFQDRAPAIRSQIVFLEQALPKNPTVEMGFAMLHLASHPEIAACTSGAEFASRIAARAFPAPFLEAWDTFVQTYGFRCPAEFDIATPRYHERLSWLYEQLCTMAGNQGASQAAFEQARANREGAERALSRSAREKGWLTHRLFKLLYRALVALGGYRESHKYYIVLGLDLLRRRILEVARSLAQDGRLDRVEQAFDLTLDDLQAAQVDPALDLRARAHENMRFRQKLARVHEFPRVIDSRGQIFRPPRRETGKGGLAGEPISPGIARGKVKVLHRPDEKPVWPGEILVAQATDPGWTTLFINAAGIVLETGGLLQHGALVAREYGKPCIAGVEDATSILEDGQLIEMDGANGTIRLVCSEEEESI